MRAELGGAVRGGLRVRPVRCGVGCGPGYGKICGAGCGPNDIVAGRVRVQLSSPRSFQIGPLFVPVSGGGGGLHDSPLCT